MVCKYSYLLLITPLIDPLLAGEPKTLEQGDWLEAPDARECSSAMHGFVLKYGGRTWVNNPRPQQTLNPTQSSPKQAFGTLRADPKRSPSKKKNL